MPRLRLTAKALHWWAKRIMASRPPDLLIGRDGDNYFLERWYVIPQSRTRPNVMVHRYLRSDGDQAHHDHPWWNLSFVLHGHLQEHSGQFEGTAEIAALSPGSVVFRRAEAAHRITLFHPDDRPITLFMTGTKSREWGFWCPKGWRHNKDFITPEEGVGKSTVGRGCND